MVNHGSGLLVIEGKIVGFRWLNCLEIDRGVEWLETTVEVGTASSQTWINAEGLLRQSWLIIESL